MASVHVQSSHVSWLRGRNTPPPSSGHIFSREGPAAAGESLASQLLPLAQRERHDGAWGSRERTPGGEWVGSSLLHPGRLMGKSRGWGDSDRPFKAPALVPWGSGCSPCRLAGRKLGCPPQGDQRGAPLLENACSPTRDHIPPSPILWNSREDSSSSTVVNKGTRILCLMAF